jgi:hypothetical protein
MLLAREPLLLACRNQLSVNEQSGVAVVAKKPPDPQ